MSHFPSIFEGNYEYLLQEVLESIDDAVLVFDNDHKVIHANAAAEDVFSGHDKRLAGTNIKHLIPKNKEGYFEQTIAELHASQHHSVELQGKKEFVGLRANDDIFYAEGKLAKLEQELYILILKDITRRKAVEGELEIALAHLKKIGSKIEYRFEHPKANDMFPVD